MTQSVPIVQTFTAREGNFTDYIAEEMQRKFLKEKEMRYRQVPNISRTKSQHLKDSRTVLRLSLPNPLKPDIESRMKM